MHVLVYFVIQLIMMQFLTTSWYLNSLNPEQQCTAMCSACILVEWMSNFEQAAVRQYPKVLSHVFQMSSQRDTSTTIRNDIDTFDTICVNRIHFRAHIHGAHSSTLLYVVHSLWCDGYTSLSKQ